MYIIKNALKCISRAKARNILIGVIVFVIALSACVGLSIRQASENAREQTLSSLTVTATISFDRTQMMNEMREENKTQSEGEQPPEFDRSSFSQRMGESSDLSLEEYEKYATAQSVKDFYYSATVSANGTEGFEPVTSEEEQSSSENTSQNQDGKMPGAMGGKNRIMGMQSDFSIVGYSGENAMTDFSNGQAAITEGAVFEEATEEYNCIITEELGVFNNLSVGDEVTISNPNNEEEVYTLKITGFYADSSANESSFSQMGATASDPANKIYMSYNALAKIISASQSASTTQTDQNTGREFETKMTSSLSPTYVFADVESYELFEEEARALGLDEKYTISSSDITAFENSLAPLETLSTMAGYFLIVILAIGGVILVVLNIFNVRERKYEIGVLTAMGMKKSKVALQFLTEIFVVTMAAVIIGVGVGGVSALPVTNALLEGQIESVEAQSNKVEQNFGRGPEDMTGQTNTPAQGFDGQGGKQFGDRFAGVLGQQAADYITQVNSAMNLTVVLQMLLIAVALTLVAGTVSMLFVMRYEPLKILANRD